MKEVAAVETETLTDPFKQDFRFARDAERLQEAGYVPPASCLLRLCMDWNDSASSEANAREITNQFEIAFFRNAEMQLNYWLFMADSEVRPNREYYRRTGVWKRKGSAASDLGSEPRDFILEAEEGIFNYGILRLNKERLADALILTRHFRWSIVVAALSGISPALDVSELAGLLMKGFRTELKLENPEIPACMQMIIQNRGVVMMRQYSGRCGNCVEFLAPRSWMSELGQSCAGITS